MGLTDRQLEVLETIADLLTTHGFAPSVRELAGALGLASNNAVSIHLNALVRKGALSRQPGQARTLTITAAGRAALETQGAA